MVAAKTNCPNPRKYVQCLLEEMPNAEDPGDPAYLDSLMPWSESAPAEVRLKPKAADETARMADDPTIVGFPRRREIAETSRSFLNRNGKTPRGLSFYAVVLTLTEQAQGESSVNPELSIVQPHQAPVFTQPEQRFQSTVPRSSLSR